MVCSVSIRLPMLRLNGDWIAESLIPTTGSINVPGQINSHLAHAPRLARCWGERKQDELPWLLGAENLAWVVECLPSTKSKILSPVLLIQA